MDPSTVYASAMMGRWMPCKSYRLSLCPLDICFLFFIYQAASKTGRNQELSIPSALVKALLLRNEMCLDGVAQVCETWILLHIDYKNENNNNRIRKINAHKGISIVSVEMDV